MAISMQELLCGADLSKLDDQTKKNLQTLLDRVNKVRDLWGKPMTVTSGLRTMEHHIEIYKEKAKKHEHPFENGIYDESKVPKASKHLYGAAVDIADPGLVLTKWLKDNPDILVKCELWCEAGNSNWCHFQVFPPNSGKRWFDP